MLMENILLWYMAATVTVATALIAVIKMSAKTYLEEKIKEGFSENIEILKSDLSYYSTHKANIAVEMNIAIKEYIKCYSIWLGLSGELVQVNYKNETKFKFHNDVKTAQLNYVVAESTLRLFLKSDKFVSLAAQLAAVTTEIRFITISLFDRNNELTSSFDAEIGSLPHNPDEGYENLKKLIKLELSHHSKRLNIYLSEKVSPIRNEMIEFLRTEITNSINKQ